MADETDDGDCELLVEAAMETATERCGSREAVFNQVNAFFGNALAPPGDLDRESPQPEDCDAILEDGIGPDDLQTTATQRRYAMCRAWELIDDEDEEMTFRQAINQAWEEVDSAVEEEEDETVRELPDA